jgi:hypothetical protein
MAGINKNFAIKNGLEVKSNLLLADSDKDSVGIGTSNINYKLHVRGGIGATDLIVTGIATFPYLSLTGTVAAGSSLGISGQYLVRSGAGVTWQDLPAFRTLTTFTATPGQTLFVVDYTVGFVDIFINGVKLSSSEFIALDSSTITVNQSCFGGETVEVVAYSTVNPGYAFTGITGISVLEEGSVVGAAGSVLILNFVGSAVTAVGSGAGVTVFITDTGGGESYWEKTSVGINTISNVGIATTNPRFALEVGPVGYADTSLWVNGNARVTGILTVGTASIVLDGSNNIINVGSGVTIDGNTGIISASNFYANGIEVGNIIAQTIVYEGGVTLTQDWTRTAAGIHTLSNVGIGTTNPTSALTVKGNTSLETLSVSGVSTFSQGADVPEGYSIGFGDGFESVHIYKESGGASSDAVINYYGSQNLKVISDSFVIQDKSNNQKFRTIGAGVTVTGTTFTNQLSVSGVSTLGIVTAGNIYSTGIVTATSFSGSNTLKERSIATGITTEIANNGIGNTDITGFKSYALMRVGLSTAGWLRLYTDSASRANDVSRSVGEDPAPGSGVIAEVVTTGISTTQIISPFVMGGNLDNPADTTIYASIQNLSGSTQAITANLTILQLEA